MNKIFHIPHSSTYIPKEYISDYLVNLDYLNLSANIICDNDLDKMVEHFKPNSIIFPYSRLFCDVERFDSDDEIMNSIGMGVLYTHNHELVEIRKKPNKDIKKYYKEHHRLFNHKVSELLESNNEVIILDLHSYSKYPLPYELNSNQQRPDICIGLNSNYNKSFVDKVLNLIKKFEYSVGINEPFSGSIIPNEFFSDKRVTSVMIEIRKDIYSTPEGFDKISNFLEKIYSM